MAPNCVRSTMLSNFSCNEIDVHKAVTLAERFTSDIYIAADGAACNAKSLLDFLGDFCPLMDSARVKGVGVLVTIGARGGDAEFAVNALIDLVSTWRR